MILVKCTRYTMSAQDRYKKSVECEKWLNDNCGKKDIDWEYSRRWGADGTISFPESHAEIATLFKLKFGI